MGEILSGLYFLHQIQRKNQIVIRVAPRQSRK
nr:MAG TPA: hypothetical protein [Caudoviricetes sp.]